MITTLAIMLGLAVLIGLHEGAHMTVAKLFGVKVIKFAIGFGPKLFSKQVGETSYELRILPLGGFVEFHGTCPSSKVARGFFTAAWWKRCLIAFAGPAMNLVLGFLMLAGLLIVAKDFTFLEAASKAWEICSLVTVQTFSWLRDACIGHAKMAEVGGPVMVTKIMADSLQVGVSQFLFILSIISLSLGLFNLLPIPALDGGHIVLYTAEGLYRKTLPIKVYEVWNMVGTILIISLILLMVFSDVFKLLVK